MIKQAQFTPDKIALASNDRVITYAELDRQATKLAKHLVRNGVIADTLVGVCMKCRVHAIIAIHGVLRAGGAYVPMEPGYPSDRLAFMIEDSGMPIVVTESDVLPRVPVLAGSANLTTVLIGDVLGLQSSDHEETDLGAVQIGPHNLAYVIYTSGTTGRPKGVLVEHAGPVSYTHLTLPTKRIV